MITSDSKIVSGGDTFSEIVAVNEVHLKQLQKLIGRMEEYFSIHNKEKFDLLSCKHKLNDTYSNSLVWSFTDEKFLVYDGGELFFDSKPENSNQLTIKLMDGDNYIISDELFFWNVKREVAITLEELKTLCFKIMNISSLTDEETRELFLEYIENVVKIFQLRNLLFQIGKMMKLQLKGKTSIILNYSFSIILVTIKNLPVWKIMIVAT